MPISDAIRIAIAGLGVSGLAWVSYEALAAPVPLPSPSPYRLVEITLPDPKPTRETTYPASGAPAEAGGREAKPDASVAATEVAATEVPAKADENTAEIPAKPEFDFTAALRPLLAYRLSSQDKANIKGTLNAVYKGRIAEADKARARIKDKAARKLADWYVLRKSYLAVPAREIEAFRKANPHWPSQKLMRRRAEYAIFVANPAPEEVFAFFKDEPPLSGEGKAALAGAYLKSGDKARAEQFAHSAWRDYKLDKKSEKLIRARFGEFLTKEVHRARIDKLLYADRKSRLARARRTADLIGPAERKKVNARAAVVRRLRSAGKLLSALPKDVKSEPGVYFSRIQYLRRRKRDKDVWKLWQAAPSDPKLIADLNEWWIERRISVRDALNAGKPKLAYEIAKNHGPLSGKTYMDAKFVSGWIALSFLKQPEVAREHFLALAAAATSPKRVARAEFWLGRTAAALGQADEAAARYSKAAQHIDTYYGQIAAQSVEPGPMALEVKPTPVPTREDVERLFSRDAVKAIAVARAAGLERLAPLFLFHLARTLDEPGEIGLLAMLARQLRMPQASVRLSKIAYNRGLAVAKYAFPTDLIPKYKRLNDGIEPALLYALSRQESEFNPKAKSHAGASGLMQLMPRTARAIARSYKVKYRRSKLTANPSYNVMLGVAHLRDLIDDFSGSYIMTLAAYNAGGPRVRQWIKRFGNPRLGDKDPIDWVEQIPFTETRNYVQKILTSIQTYRASLEGPERALQIVQDLNRGREDGRAAAVTTGSTDTTAARN